MKIRYPYTPISISRCKRLLGVLVLAAVALCTVFPLGADNTYAPSSRLSKGRWMRVSVSETGMQFVSNTQLKNMGLDPAKTRVYGFGGRMVPDNFPEGLPDDLPLLPSVATSSGIVFYGTDHITWYGKDRITSDGNSKHTMHPYCEQSYYFLSDTDPCEETAMGEAPLFTPDAVGAVTTFEDCILHEQDIFGPSHTGSDLLGEDFRAQSSRTFSFQLPGNTSEPVTARVRFAALTTNGKSRLSFSANGTQLPATPYDEINSIGGKDVFMVRGLTTHEIPKAGDKLNFGITYTPGGAVTLARLDWIEVLYVRNLALSGGDLHFGLDVRSGQTFRVEGCSSDTRIWDVTVPHAPREVKFTLSGTAALFAPAESGYREYVAFSPAKVKRAAASAGRVSNQDIHSLPVPDMVIITPPEYMAASERLAAMHRKVDGMTVHVLTPQAIYNEFTSGSADIGAFRKMLRMWRDRGEENPEGAQVRYCLIMSKPTYDNKMQTPAVKSTGYPRVPIWQSCDRTSTSNSYSTDDIIGMLDHNMASIGSAAIHVAVGRIPATSVAEAEGAVNKIINYVMQPEYGSWRNHVMLVADDDDHAKHMSQMESVYRALTTQGNGDSFVYDRVYFDAYPIVPTASGFTYPGAKARLLDRWNDGVGFINYIGHANTVSWSHEKILLWEDITSFSNERLPILYAATCEFACWDADSQSGGEIMMLNPNGGYVTGIVPSRSVLIDKNGVLSANTMAEFFKRDADGKGRRVGDIMVAGKNTYINDDNKLRYCLLGDPALRIISPSHKVVTETIGDMAADAEPQTLGARASVKVSGCIMTPDGVPADDFNGIIEVSLYDAERAVTTNGNGETGEPFDYNDRSTRLAAESTVVTGGRWETVLRLPSDIENNFSPAMLSYYAYSDAGMEANGMCDNLYVYGYDETAPEDNAGPVIEIFTLNHEGFAMGDATHSSPIVMATFSDESGINLSDASLGHDITLRLDGKQTFDDVASRFVPDPYRDGAGSITYALEDLEPGTHELELKVWDNAGNSSSSTLLFNVALRKSAGIMTLATRPADGNTLLSVTLDRPASGVKVLFEIYTLGGHRVWHSEVAGSGRTSNVCSVAWPRCDDAGRTVGRDIYVCRATVTTEDGSVSRSSTKIAVGAAI
ncbi:MAG: type IX secretion system sortase PorU [Muribaculaceae bacterium]|nr:type IX secretion system sortase PorU [Muribaculaceae bacterium]